MFIKDDLVRINKVLNDFIEDNTLDIKTDRLYYLIFGTNCTAFDITMIKGHPSVNSHFPDTYDDKIEYDSFDTLYFYRFLDKRKDLITRDFESDDGLFCRLYIGDKFLLFRWDSIRISSTSYLVYAENKVRQTATIVFVSSLIGLVLSVIVAPKYGAVGCAASTGFALVLTQILYIRFFHKKMGLDMSIFFKKCHLRIMPVLVGYGLAAYILCQKLVFDNWINLVVSIVIYTLGYIIIVWFLLLNKDEKDLIMGFIKAK